MKDRVRKKAKRVMSNNNMIEVKNVSKEFKKIIKEPGLKGSVKSLFHKKQEIVKAVDDISFSVEKGSLFAFLGLNGAGKSTTINMICKPQI